VEKFRVGSKDWSVEKRVRIHFWRYLHKGHLKNVELDSPCAELSTNLSDDDDEVCVVRITAKNGVDYYLTNTRIISTASETATIMWYQDLVKLEWVTDSLDVEEKVRLKQLYYDRIFLRDGVGNQISLSDLDQAVFPLIKFLNKVITDNTKQKSEC
jgi:hypothetical protein